MTGIPGPQGLFDGTTGTTGADSGETLAAILGQGNETGGTNLEVTDGDSIAFLDAGPAIDTTLIRNGDNIVELVVPGSGPFGQLRCTHQSMVTLTKIGCQMAAEILQLREGGDFGWAQGEISSGLDARFHRTATKTVEFDDNAGAAATLNVLGALGTKTVNGALLSYASNSELLSGLAGASVTTSGLVPAGCRIMFVVARVTTAITGATDWDMGDGVDVDRYGAALAIALNTTVDGTDATADPEGWSAAAQEVTLTANGGNFTGGAVRVTAFYLQPTAPTS